MLLRNILAVILGLVIGNIAIMGLHYLSMLAYPFPNGVEMSDIDAIASYIKTAPLGSLILVMVAHLGGTFISGISVALVRANIKASYIVGGFFTLAGIYNLYVLPHPIWFNIEAILYFPAAMYGYKLIEKTS